MSRGMERWEIGDIASKIGQLYYNYYLRTSEIRFLHESYVFYEAIRSRSYFAQASRAGCGAARRAAGSPWQGCRILFVQTPETIVRSLHLAQNMLSAAI
jgi:hypothetical protein